MQMLRNVTGCIPDVSNRRFFRSRLVLLGIVVAVSGAVLFLGAATQRIWAAEEAERVVVAPGRAASKINLRDRLVVGLQARLKSEVAFVELVAAKVRTGQLPQRLVDETFLWARQRVSNGRTSHSYRPIVFFQPAMRARAKRLKVDL